MKLIEWIDWNEMRKHDISEKDVLPAARQFLNCDDLSQAKAVVPEPNGTLSGVRK